MKMKFLLEAGAKVAFLAVLSFALARALEAAFFGNMSFPDSVRFNRTTLYLNGLAVRKKTLFKVQVYVAALYVGSRTRDGNAILRSPGPKALEMTFLRDVSAEQMVSGWNEGFRRACASRCSVYEKRLIRFDSFVPAIKRGQRVEFAFLRDGMTIRSGTETRKVEGRDFADMALASFIGPNAQGDEVHDALLGLPS